MKTQTILEKPLVSIPDYARNLNRDLRQSLPRELDALAERAVYVSSYVEALNDGGSHSDAVKAAQKRVAKVRKVLGYSYPGQGLASVTI